MPQRPFDGGDAAALICHYYHLKPWELDDLTDEQRDTLLSRVGLIRYYNDLPVLQAQFAKIDEEGIEKIISGSTDPKASRRALAWEIYALRPYGLLVESDAASEAVSPLASISPEAAEGIVQWVESGDLYKLPEGAMVWRLSLLGIHKQLLARAEQYRP